MHLLVLGVMYAELSSRIGLDLVFLGSKMIVAMAWNLYSLAGILVPTIGNLFCSCEVVI